MIYEQVEKLLGLGQKQQRVKYTCCLKPYLLGYKSREPRSRES